jgi:hypothetical protein
MNFLSKCMFFCLIAFGLISCQEGKKNQTVEVNSSEEVKEAKKATPDMADSSFKDGMTGTVYHYYLKVRTALFNKDVESAATSAEDMAESFDQSRPELKKLAMQISESEEIAQQRELFSQFTGEVESLFKQNLSGGTIYKQHCPMAFNNKGASWFSEVDEIKNPYYGEGDKMHNCGAVKETIKPKK